MVFLIQNTQNRDSKAIHLKLDELLYAVKEARSGLVLLEDRSDAELEELEKEFRHVARREAAAVVEDEIEKKVKPERKVRGKKAAGARSS
jgi:low affinity Fe/Cu permease